MKVKFLFILILFIALTIPSYSQLYNKSDSLALLAIKTSCDASNQLNWDTQKDPAGWKGVTWNYDYPRRVSELQLTSLGMTGALNLTPLTQLTSVTCWGNQLSSLNVSNLPNLTILQCEENKLTDLTLSGSTNLTRLTCYKNLITSLSLSGLTKLAYLDCGANKIATLDVSSSTNLTYIACASNLLTSLSVSNMPNLDVLRCYNNQLTNLDLSGLPVLTWLDFSDNLIINMDVSPFTKLIYLNVSTNNLTGLNVSNLTDLTKLFCDFNQLTNLEVSTLTNLVEFHGINNKLTNLDFSSLSKLTKITCSGNQLKTLNLSSLINLTELWCNGNYLTSLDVSSLTNLTSLACQYNLLTNLDVSSLFKITYLDCSHNKLPFTSLAKGLNVGSYSYNPQDSIFSRQTFSNNTTLDYSSEAMVSGSSTNFTFFKDGNQIISNSTGQFTTTGSGVYYCQMINSKFTGLTLTTAKVTITPALSVSVPSLNIEATANSHNSFTISSNTTWSINSSESWLTADISAGSNDGTIILTATANSVTTTRMAIITVSAVGVTPQVISITQAAATPVLLPSASSLNIDAPANSHVSFTISSNTAWSINSSESWLTTDISTGSNDGTIILTATSNPATTARVATITISALGLTSQIISVTQAAKEATGVKDIDEDIIIYPNPVTDIIRIKLTPVTYPSEVTICTMDGRILFHTKSGNDFIEINMGNFNPGIYVLITQNVGTIIKRKIVKK